MLTALAQEYGWARQTKQRVKRLASLAQLLVFIHISTFTFEDSTSSDKTSSPERPAAGQGVSTSSLSDEQAAAVHMDATGHDESALPPIGRQTQYPSSRTHSSYSAFPSRPPSAPITTPRVDICQSEQLHLCLCQFPGSCDRDARSSNATSILPTPLSQPLATRSIHPLTTCRRPQASY